MNRIQRYLLRELLASFLLLLGIVTAIVGAALMLQFLHKAPELGLIAVVRALPYVLPEAFPITLPLAFLVACLLAYGRFADDNEFTAFRMGGMHPWQAIVPAILLGAVLSLGTLWLNSDVLPWATLGKKEVVRDQIQQLIRALERGASTKLTLGDSFLMSAERRESDGAFKDVQITFRGKADESGKKKGSADPLAGGPFDLRAERAWLWLSEDGELLNIRLEKLRSVRQDTRLTQEEGRLAIELDQLVSASPREKAKDEDQMTGEELLYRLARGSPNAELVREWEAEYWRRIAMGFAPLFFGLLGAPLGLFSARGSRASAFLMGLVVALPVYYPLLRLGENLAIGGVLPAPIAMMLGNALLAVAGGWLVWRIVRV